LCQEDWKLRGEPAGNFEGGVVVGEGGGLIPLLPSIGGLFLLPPSLLLLLLLLLMQDFEAIRSCKVLVKLNPQYISLHLERVTQRSYVSKP